MADEPDELKAKSDERGTVERYGSHRDYIQRIQEDVIARQENVEVALRAAFANYIERREVEVIIFSSVDVLALAAAIEAHPVILKSLLAGCNLAGRAIERDLGIKNLDTYVPRFKENQAAAIAGYIKPFLPAYLELPTLSYIDRISYIDKEIRKGKGNWEKSICKATNEFGKPRTFRKTMFKVAGDEFELDAAAGAGGSIELGIDVKRIEARRDIHKRCDEIVNKAAKFKTAFPDGKFGVVVYYPFMEEHINVQNRLRSSNIDGVVFASESADSINNAVKLLLAMLGVMSQ